MTVLLVAFGHRPCDLVEELAGGRVLRPLAKDDIELTASLGEAALGVKHHSVLVAPAVVVGGSK